MNDCQIFASRNENSRNKIQVIISGSADRKALVNNPSLNYLFADGGNSHLSQNIYTYLMPIVSANYKSMSEKERIEFITFAHLENKKVRFWNTDDNKKSWNKLIQLDVDLIGVDHLKKFDLFLNKI